VIVYTDSPAFGADLLGELEPSWTGAAAPADASLATLVERLYADRPIYAADIPGNVTWSHVFAVEAAERSQYDILVELIRAGLPLPSGVACIAGRGRGFHGFRGRPWLALAGNIHFSAHLSMPPNILDSVADVIALAAVSVVDAIDGIPDLEERAGIKWVNDVLIDDAKVCGILAHLEASDHGVTSVVVGIGLNVETTPEVPPTPFVPRVEALRTFAGDPARCSRRTVLVALMASLDRNYRRLLDRGASALRQRYRERSMVVGRSVAVCAEGTGSEAEVLAEGTVAALGERLELVVQGYPHPFVNGRLILRPIGPRGRASG
jgi:BirA family biotin operon repressor/biotin-[acetyl-CoA-carboxylase] ligase